jgi:O-antigen ligase
LRWPPVAAIFILLGIALPLLGYPLAILPREWATQRFDFYFPWTALAVAVLLLGVAIQRTSRLPFSGEAGWFAAARCASHDLRNKLKLELQHRHAPEARARWSSSFGLFLSSCSKADLLLAAPVAVLVSQLVSALSAGPSAGQVDALLRTATNIFLCLAAARLLTARWLRPVAVAWAVAAAVEAVVMLLQAVLHAEPVGMAGNRNFAACFLAMSLPIGVAGAMTWDRSRRREEAAAPHTATFPPPHAGGYERSIAWCIAASYGVLLLAAIMVSESRGAALSLLLVAAGGWLMRARGTRRWALAGAVVIVAAGLALLPPVRTAAGHLWNTDVRPMIWLGSARAVADAPLAGHGPGSFARVYPAHRPPEYFDRPKCARVTDHAHNEFLEIAVETGALGVLAFLALLGVTALAARRAIARGDGSLRPVAVGVTMGWGVLVLQNLVDINLFMPPNDALFWLMTGWLLCASRAGSDNTTAERTFAWHPAARLAAGAAGLLVLAVGVIQEARANWFFREGAVARTAGDERRALDCFTRVVHMDPERMEAWRQAGLAAHRLGDLDAAVAAFRRAHALMPDYADLNGELGALLAMKRDFAGAAQLLTRATRLFPRDPANFVKLALVRLSLNEPEAARRAFEEAKQLDPNHELVRWADKKFSQPEDSRRAP